MPNNSKLLVANTSIIINGMAKITNKYEVPFSDLFDHSNFSKYIMYSYGNFLDRIEYISKLKDNEDDIQVEFSMDFWNQKLFENNLAVLPDQTCLNKCENLSVNAVQNLEDYKNKCQTSSPTFCQCSHVSNTSHFCLPTWPISININFNETDIYANSIWDKISQSLGNSAPPTCLQELKDFTCKFYFPLCSNSSNSLKPSLKLSLSCFGNSSLFNSIIKNTHSYDLITNANPDSKTYLYQNPSSVVISNPEPQHFYFNDNQIDIIIKFVLFSGYDTSVGLFQIYPDVYTLRIWQIILMLVAMSLLIITIIGIVITSNRKTVSYYKKI